MITERQSRNKDNIQGPSEGEAQCQATLRSLTNRSVCTHVPKISENSLLKDGAVKM